MDFNYVAALECHYILKYILEYAIHIHIFFFCIPIYISSKTINPITLHQLKSNRFYFAIKL